MLASRHLNNMTSPVIKKVTPSMTFPEAMAKIIAGYKVARLEWGSNDEYGYRKDGLLMIHTKGQDHKWIVADGDYLNNDWVVVKEQSKNN